MKRVTDKKTKTEKQKKKKNIRFILLALIMVIIVLFVSIRVLPTIRTIDVEIRASKELTRITKEQVLELSGLKKGDKLYKELRSKIEQRIEESPYIESAKIERSLSGKVKIIVTQRDPAYIINCAGEYIYIDKEGYVLEISNENSNIPILIGVTTDFSDLSVGNTKIRLDKVDLEKIDVLNNILLALKSNNIENRITAIDITNKKDFILKLEDDGKEVYIGDGSNINTKALYMKKILETEAGHTGAIYINGNLDEGYVYFKEQ